MAARHATDAGWMSAALLPMSNIMCQSQRLKGCVIWSDKRWSTVWPVRGVLTFLWWKALFLVRGSGLVSSSLARTAFTVNLFRFIGLPFFARVQLCMCCAAVWRWLLWEWKHLCGGRPCFSLLLGGCSRLWGSANPQVLSVKLEEETLGWMPPIPLH